MLHFPSWPVQLLPKQVVMAAFLCCMNHQTACLPASSVSCPAWIFDSALLDAACLTIDGLWLYLLNVHAVKQLSVPRAKPFVCPLVCSGRSLA